MTTDAIPRTSTESSGWTADDSTFGARLALVRQRMKWGNVVKAALATGYPPETWRGWERDNVVPRDVRVIARKIANVTGCDYRWLLDGPGGEAAAPNDRSNAEPIGYRDHGRPRTAPPTRRTPHRPFGPVRPGDTRPQSSVPPTRRRPMPITGPLGR